MLCIVGKVNMWICKNKYDNLLARLDVLEQKIITIDAALVHSVKADRPHYSIQSWLDSFDIFTLKELTLMLLDHLKLTPIKTVTHKKVEIKLESTVKAKK